MAVYTRVDAAALVDFLARFDLPAPTVFKGIAEGVENSNYLLETSGTRYILTLYEKRVDPADLPYFLGLMDHVVAKGVPAARPIRDRDGDILQTLCGRPAALISFVEGTSPDTPSPAQAKAAGAALAELHQATADFSKTRPNSLSVEGWQQLATDIGADLDRFEPGLTHEIGEAIQHLAEAWPHQLPAGTIHADLFPDNVLFLDDEVSGMIDFYFACTDLYAYDLAISMNAWIPEETHAPELARAFREGYERVRPLSSDEAAALPTLLQGAALRFFLTRAYDWLNQVPGSLVRVKDPLPYLRLMRLNRDHPETLT